MRRSAQSAWCDLQQCITGDGAARHTSTATPDGLHVLTLPEIKALAETLLIEYLKAASLVPATRNPGDTTVATKARIP